MEAGEAGKGSPSRKAMALGFLVLAVLVGAIVWIVAWGGDDDGEAGSGASIGAEARIVSEEELSELAADAGHSVFWAGPIEGTELEVSDEGGNVLVRYLDQGSEVGSEVNEALAVGSYPVEDPVAAVERLAAREGAIVTEAGDGRELVGSARTPGSVYFADPDGGVQVEVYAPSPRGARRLAASGQVEPIG